MTARAPLAYPRVTARWIRRDECPIDWEARLVELRGSNLRAVESIPLCRPDVVADGRFVGIRNRRYGRTVLAIYVRSPSGKLDLTPYSEEFVSLSKK